MADSQQIEQPAAVTSAKRNSFLRHVQIHMDLLQDSLTGKDFGCGVGEGEGDREKIDRHLQEIWRIVWAAKLIVVDPRPAPSAPSGDDAPKARSNQNSKVIPFRPRLVG
jgi:hypothetical protein